MAQTKARTSVGQGVPPSYLRIRAPVTATALWPPSVSLRDHGGIGWCPLRH
jgi:hypothetical protein